MKHHRMSPYLLGGLLFLFSLFLVACSQDGETVEVTRIVEVTVEVPGETVTETVEVTRVVEVAPEVPAGPSVPYEEQWASSPHADASAEAFVHWNEEDPAEVPDRCAKCHSTPGFQDWQ